MNKVEVIEVDMDRSDGLKVADKKMSDLVEEYNENGFKVISVSPISKGYYDSAENQSYGYSYTAGFLIVFEQFKK